MPFGIDLKLVLGLVLGVVVVAFMYGRQSWNNRQGLGLSFYGAETLRRRMFTIAAAGFGLFLVLGVVFFLQMVKSGDLSVANDGQEAEPVLSTIGPARLYIGKMALDAD